MLKSWLVAVPSALVASILSITLVGQAQPVQTPSTIAYVSVNRLTSDSTHARTELGRLQALQQQKAADLRTKQQALEATRQQILDAPDRAVRAQLAQQEQQQRLELEKAQQQAQADIQNLQRQVNADLQRRVQTAVADLVKTQNFQLVLNSDTSVVWSAPGLDMTAAVVQRLNAQ